MCAQAAEKGRVSVKGKGEGSSDSSYNKGVSSAAAAQRSAKREKSSSAFRTISEVADDLGVKQHVLRFWETKFSQLKPLKRGGGRRYYRPEDISLLKSIHHLLYIEGYTIKGVQKLLRDAGRKQVVAMFSSISSDETSNMADLVASHDCEGKTSVNKDVGSEGELSSVEARQENALTPEQRASLEAVLSELRELRGMIKKRG